MIKKLVVLMAVTSLFAAACAWAQSSGAATLQGSVKDASGAVIPAAKVTATHIDTGVKSNTVANNEGFFIFPPMQIGKYRVRCEATGMKAWEGDTQLETGKIVEINPTLTLGDVAQTVSVSADVPMISTTDPTDATTLDQQRIKELPINGRDLNTLIMDVTPGIEYGGNVNDGARTGGLMQYATTYSQDGAAANNREFGGSQGLQGLESVGEVRIETSTGNAKSSTPASVTVSTRSGTNRLTFSLYETARNNCCGVAKHLQDVNPNGAPFPLPKLIRNEYGGSAGGALMLPSFGLNGKKTYDGHNRTFFFVSREQLDLRQGLTYSFSVPTLAQRQGNFSGLETNTGLPITLYDPQTSQIVTQAKNPTQYTTRSPFPNNTIPVSRESPLAKYIYGITPLPTDNTEPNIASNLKYSIGNSSLPSQNNNPTTIKIDHRITAKDNFYAKANWSTTTSWFLGTSSLGANSVGGSTGVPTTNNAANVTYLEMQGWGGALGETHVFSSTFFVETLLNKAWLTSKTIDGPPGMQQDWATYLGLPNPYGQIGWPNLQSVGTNYSTYIEGDNRRALSSGIMTGQQNYTWIKNNHTIGFGGTFHDEILRLQPDQGNISGSATFNSLATALESSTSGSVGTPATIGNTGFDAANFFLGDAATYSVYLSRGTMKMDQKTYGLYIQDNWRVNGRLTLTPGLRWDMNPAWNDENHLINSFDLKNHAVVLAEPLSYYVGDGATTQQVVDNFQKVNVKFETWQQAGMKSGNFFSSHMFNMGPRMGVAYRFLDGRKAFIVRGGYGMYFSALPIRSLLAPFSTQLPFKATFQYNPNSSAYSPDGNNSYLLTHASPIVAGMNSTNIVDITNPNSLGIGQSVEAMTPNLPTTTIHEWNVEIEKELGHNMVVRFTYDGKHALNLDQTTNLNPQMTTYDWYASTLQPTPTGAYSSVARGTYDTTAYTNVYFLGKTGFSNSSMFTGQMEKRFSHGLQFQIFYTLMNAYRLGGNSTRDSVGTTAAAFLPGSVPTDPAALNKFLNYQRDTGVPKHRVRWNWIYDLPFGRNRAFASNAPKWLNAMIGGWTLTGSGTVVSTWFALDSSDWGFTGAPVQVYGTKYPIEDCTATPASARTPQDVRCYKAYYYWNGYISSNRINSVNAYGMPNGIEGLPSGLKPAVTPLVPYGTPGAVTGDYDTNNVYIVLSNGTRQQVAYNTGLNPFRNQYRLGPFNWVMDSSIRKTFKFTESGRVNLRVALDVFNVLNNPGLNTPGANGIVDVNTSFGAYGFVPRQCQGSFRLEF
jgi:hypothetical protein